MQPPFTGGSTSIRCSILTCNFFGNVILRSYIRADVTAINKRVVARFPYSRDARRKNFARDFTTTHPPMMTSSFVLVNPARPIQGRHEAKRGRTISSNRSVLQIPGSKVPRRSPTRDVCSPCNLAKCPSRRGRTRNIQYPLRDERSCVRRVKISYSESRRSPPLRSLVGPS